MVKNPQKNLKFRTTYTDYNDVHVMSQVVLVWSLFPIPHIISLGRVSFSHDSRVIFFNISAATALGVGGCAVLGLRVSGAGVCGGAGCASAVQHAKPPGSIREPGRALWGESLPSGSRGCFGRGCNDSVRSQPPRLLLSRPGCGRVAVRAHAWLREYARAPFPKYKTKQK